MKRVFFLFAFVLAAAVVSAQTAPVITFDSETIDYGKVVKGANGEREFKFTNTGTAPLVISGAKGSCGCTVPTYPKEPIMPQETGVIKVKYDTNRVGPFTKTVTVTSNDPSTKTLKIQGTVVEEAEPIPANKSSLMSPK